jgi:glycosyltransferase involved in cell wall biosynthesis
MRILALTRYSSKGPSSRVRFYQYFPYLTACGVELQVVPLLDDDYILRLYAGQTPSIFPVVGAYARRIAKLMKSRSFDLLWIEKELFPWLPAWAERILAGSGIPYVVDYDDAVFHRYDMHANPIIRGWLGRSIDSVMYHASTVVVGNDYLAGHARQAGAVRIEYLPSVVDIDRYSIREKAEGKFRIGWIGSPVTAPYLGLIRDALEQAIQQLDVRLVLVGAGNRDPLPGLAKDILPWSEAEEVADIQSFDAGIMPLPDGPFERGKCGYKLIQYMACGLPVIASPVGVNTDIVEEGRTGFLPTSNADWVQAFALLSQDAEMRKAMGKAGRRKIEQEYSLQMAAPRLLDILTKAAAYN